MKEPRVIVIGLDGASWNLLKPWIEEGWLLCYHPVLQKFSRFIFTGRI